MKKLLPILAIFIALYIGWSQFNRPNDSAGPTDQTDTVFANAFEKGNSGIQVEGNGIVIKILPDDNDGSRHQRFILRLHSGQTLFISHNIDLAPRISSLKEEDVVAFNGIYEWNSKGGVIHWTHRDPQGYHAAGWLQHNDQIYQ